jgi:hypothetical protein
VKLTRAGLDARSVAGIADYVAAGVDGKRHTARISPDRTTRVGTVPGTKAGDLYRYVIEVGGTIGEYNDPRAQQRTGFDLPNGFGLPGKDR